MISIAVLTVADVLEKCRDQCWARQDDRSILRALENFIENVIADDCEIESREYDVKDPKAVENLTVKMVSSEKLTRPVARFVANSDSIENSSLTEKTKKAYAVEKQTKRNA